MFALFQIDISLSDLSLRTLQHIYKDSTYFTPSHGGDHLAHFVTFASPSQLRGRGYWKCPLFLFEYPDIVEAIKYEAKTVLSQLQASHNPGKLWEQWKKRIKRLLQALQVKIKSQERQAITQVHNHLEKAASHYKTHNSQQKKNLYEAALREYNECIVHSSKYNQDSSFDFHMRNSEKSSRHFFRALDTSYRKVSIEEVISSNGTVSTNPLEITLQFVNHWSEVMGDFKNGFNHHQPPRDEPQEILLRTIQKTLSSDEDSLLSSPLTAKELSEAIKHMRGHSSPGMDGLPAAFYQISPDLFGECLRIVFNYQLTRGTLLRSQRRSAITLLYKKGSRADPGNYRPIALMCVDVKVLSKVLAYRLQHVLPRLIHPDQKAFVRGRSIHQHIRFLKDFQDLSTHRSEEAYATFLDFEKAYDRVDWNYMYRVLQKMGFGEAFIQWIKLLYHDTKVSLLLNGSLSPEISPSRGVKQGDPLSAFLFILAIEPLGNLLRQREEYGVSINDNVVLTNLLFADDTTLLSNSLSGVMEQLELVQIYCDGSGAKLNLSKSTMLVLNRTQNRPIFPHVKILSKTESVKYLGIPFSQSSVQELIMEILEKRFYDGFRMWFRRARTVRGRLLMAQTMILSRLWHYTTHFDVPQQLLRRWQSMLNKFVLSRKYEQNSTHVQLIRKEFLYMPRKQGGLQVPYMEAQLKKQRMLFLQQFISFSETTEIGHWKLPGNELLRSVSPAFGPFQSLDTLTISPKRNGDMVKWNIISSWWIQTITWFQEIR